MSEPLDLTSRSYQLTDTDAQGVDGTKTLALGLESFDIERGDQRAREYLRQLNSANNPDDEALRLLVQLSIISVAYGTLIQDESLPARTLEAAREASMFAVPVQLGLWRMQDLAGRVSNAAKRATYNDRKSWHVGVQQIDEEIDKVLINRGGMVSSSSSATRSFAGPVYNATTSWAVFPLARILTWGNIQASLYSTRYMARLEARMKDGQEWEQAMFEQSKKIREYIEAFTNAGIADRFEALVTTRRVESSGASEAASAFAMGSSSARDHHHGDEPTADHWEADDDDDIGDEDSYTALANREDFDAEESDLSEERLRQFLGDPSRGILEALLGVGASAEEASDLLRSRGGY